MIWHLDVVYSKNALARKNSILYAFSWIDVFLDVFNDFGRSIESDDERRPFSGYDNLQAWTLFKFLKQSVAFSLWDSVFIDFRATPQLLNGTESAVLVLRRETS